MFLESNNIINEYIKYECDGNERYMDVTMIKDECIDPFTCSITSTSSDATIGICYL